MVKKTIKIWYFSVNMAGVAVYKISARSVSFSVRTARSRLGGQDFLAHPVHSSNFSKRGHRDMSIFATLCGDPTNPTGFA